MRRYQYQRGEIGPITADITREQRASADRRMGADEEIGEYPGSYSPRFAISGENLACQKQRLSRDRGQFQPDLVKETVDLFDPIVADRQF